MPPRPTGRDRGRVCSRIATVPALRRGPHVSDYRKLPNSDNRKLHTGLPAASDHRSFHPAAPERGGSRGSLARSWHRLLPDRFCERRSRRAQEHLVQVPEIARLHAPDQAPCRAEQQAGRFDAEAGVGLLVGADPDASSCLAAAETAVRISSGASPRRPWRPRPAPTGGSCWRCGWSDRHRSVNAGCCSAAWSRIGPARLTCRCSRSWRRPTIACRCWRSLTSSQRRDRSAPRVGVRTRKVTDAIDLLALDARLEGEIARPPRSRVVA